MGNKRRRYTDEERASLVVMLESEGYPTKKGALQKVADYAKIPPSTLQRWFHGTNNPPPTQLANKKKIDLRQAIEEELNAIFNEMVSKREDASYRDLGTVAGILFDKKQLIEEKPTERIAHEHSGELTVTERRSRINELLDRARTRRNGDTSQPGIRSTDD